MNARSIVALVAVIVLAAGVWFLKQYLRKESPADTGNAVVQTAVGDACPTPAGPAVRHPGEIPLADSAGLAAKLGVPKGKPAMVDFGSTTCIPCKEMAVNMEAAEKRVGEQAMIMFVNVNEQKELSQLAGISIIPTQIFFDANGNEAGRHVGVLTVDEIVARLTAKRDGAAEGG